MNFRNHSLKRIFDKAVAGVALVAVAPVIGVAGYLVSRETGSSMIFVQERIGLNEELFKIHKIRTMREPFNAAGEKLSHEERTGPIGRFLRRSKIDELPQLRNVWKGEMSLVGPRPLMRDDTVLAFYHGHDLDKRHSVLPGMTGLAQLHGMNTMSPEQIVAYDNQYANHHSFWGDIKILVKTPLSIFMNWKDPHCIPTGMSIKNQPPKNYTQPPTVS